MAYTTKCKYNCMTSSSVRAVDWHTRSELNCILYYGCVDVIAFNTTG